MMYRCACTVLLASTLENKDTYTIHIRSYGAKWSYTDLDALIIRTLMIGPKVSIIHMHAHV